VNNEEANDMSNQVLEFIHILQARKKLNTHLDVLTKDRAKTIGNEREIFVSEKPIWHTI
jgi:hypothetical protein